MAGIGFELRKIYNEDNLFFKTKGLRLCWNCVYRSYAFGDLLTAGVVVLTW